MQFVCNINLIVFVVLQDSVSDQTWRVLRATRAWAESVYQTVVQEARQKGITFPNAELSKIMSEIAEDYRQISQEVRSDIIDPMWERINNFLEGPTASYIKQLSSWTRTAIIKIHDIYTTKIKELIQTWRETFGEMTGNVWEGEYSYICHFLLRVYITAEHCDIKQKTHIRRIFFFYSFPLIWNTKEVTEYMHYNKLVTSAGTKQILRWVLTGEEPQLFMSCMRHCFTQSEAALFVKREVLQPLESNYPDQYRAAQQVYENVMETLKEDLEHTRQYVLKSHYTKKVVKVIADTMSSVSTNQDIHLFFFNFILLLLLYSFQWNLNIEKNLYKKYTFHFPGG